MNIENVSTLKIHRLAHAQYEREVAAGNVDETAIYMTPEKYLDEYLDSVSDLNLVGKLGVYCRDSVTEANRCYRLGAHLTDSSPVYFENGFWIFEIIKSEADGVCYITGTNGKNTVTFTSDGETVSEREFSNPLLVLGWEYRTTERYMGKAVYTKVINFGSLPNSEAKSVAFCTDGATAVSDVRLMLSSGFVFSSGYGKDRNTNVTAGINLDNTLYNVRVHTEADFSSLTAHAIVKYTKD